MTGAPVARIRRLSVQSAAVFGSWLVERMIGRFELFCCDTGYKGVSTLRIALNQVLNKIENSSQADKFIDSEDCYSLAPDSEEFSSIFTSSAIDAANSTGMLVDFTLNGDINLICDISELSIESVDMLIQHRMDEELSGDELDAYIKNHPSMRNEIAMQRHFISVLEPIPDDDNFWREVLCNSIEFRQKYRCPVLG